MAENQWVPLGTWRAVVVPMLCRRAASFLLVPLVLTTTVAACTPSDSDVEGAGSALNYRSTAGQEYVLTTEVTFMPPPGFETVEASEREAHLVKQAEAVRSSVATLVTAYLDEIWPEAVRTARPTDVAIQLRQASPSMRDIQPVDGGLYKVTVSAEFAGSEGIEDKLPLKTVEGKKVLPIPVPPSTPAISDTELRFSVESGERSLNSYPRYLELFQDGLDVSIHVGADYNKDRNDVSHARSIYNDLLISGFKSPVPSFDELKIDSGPMVSAITVKEALVPVRVRIFYQGMSSHAEDLFDAFKESVKSADVIVYDGHAARDPSYAGIVVQYNPRRAMAIDEFARLETTDKQQVYFFNGCETYAAYADGIYRNPKRNSINTDVITAGNYSALGSQATQVLAFVHALTDSSVDAFGTKTGPWLPRSWDGVLGALNEVGERSWVHVYGVHGVDDNPKLSPLADASKVGMECTGDRDCGAPDSRCIEVSDSKKVCGAACADSTACPDGTRCVLPKGRTSPDDFQCLSR